MGAKVRVIFDNGGFAARAKQDGKKSGSKGPDWNDGFNAGYGAAVDRYIKLELQRK